MIRRWRLGLLLMMSLCARSAQPAEPAKPAPVTLTGRIVCMACELKLQYQAPSDCATSGHLFGFLATDGNLFTLLETDRSRPVIKGEKLAYQVVQIKGRRYPKSMILEIQEIQPAPPGSVKTYYCKLCAITTFDPGPCVCCGEPVEEKK